MVYYDDPMYQASCSLTGQEESVDINNWDGVYGDVSIKYALNHLIETTDEEFVPYLEGFTPKAIKKPHLRGCICVERMVI